MIPCKNCISLAICNSKLIDHTIEKFKDIKELSILDESEIIDYLKRIYHFNEYTNTKFEVLFLYNECNIFSAHIASEGFPPNGFVSNKEVNKIFPSIEEIKRSIIHDS